jgi:hypothetical protein
MGPFILGRKIERNGIEKTGDTDLAGCIRGRNPAKPWKCHLVTSLEPVRGTPHLNLTESSRP